MDRCPHKNLNLYEYSRVHTLFEFTDGKPPEDGVGYHSDAAPTGELRVTCSDCGLDHLYTPRSTRPKWVVRAWEALMEVQQLEWSK